jgi:hypothetical protein
MGIVHDIGWGERQWFRRCRRAWDLGSPNRQNWQRRDSRAVDLTSAVRQALAVWYFPGMWEWPRPVVLPRALQAFDQTVAAATGRAAADEDATRSARQMLERYFTWAPTVDAFAPVRVEADFEANVPDRRSPGHDLVDADGRPVRYRDRLELLVVDKNDAYWVVEHRLTIGGWADRDELLLAERPLAGAWGWEQFYFMVIAGTVHNELRLVDAGAAGSGTGEVDEAAVARRPRARDWARSRFAGRRADVPDDIVVQEDGEWFRRTWVPRQRAEIDAVADRLFAEALDMLDPGLALYPSPAPDHCSNCDYRLPCITMNQGGDVDRVLADAYQRREGNLPEEGRLGGGTWSMNRGAAPPPQWRKPPP